RCARRVSERVAAIASAARMVRMLLQISTLGIGAWLVLQNEVLSGSLIASSLLVTHTSQRVTNAFVCWANGGLSGRAARINQEKSIVGCRTVRLDQTITFIHNESRSLSRLAGGGTNGFLRSL